MPNGCALHVRTSAISWASVGGSTTPACRAATVPSPPAAETAAASAGGDTRPIPACWIGTEQPTNCVNRVASIDYLTSLGDRRGGIKPQEGAAGGLIVVD